MKKNKFLIGAFALIIVAIAGINVSLNTGHKSVSAVKLANIQAIALEVGNVPWYDYINNYLGTPQQIPVSTVNCMTGTYTYQGQTVSVGLCIGYTWVIYTPCFDGGSKNECTSDKITYL
ncbi:hypothetical protein FACS189430_07150 [Bacteroidia bacterium]|nr:hypothetical protein FACS189430_07150 [Bacteroidia bacterium]